MIGRHYRGMVVVGRQALSESREWSGGPPGGPGVVGRPSRSDGSDWVVHPEEREWSGAPPGWPEVIGRLGLVWRSSHRVESSRDTLQDGRSG